MIKFVFLKMAFNNVLSFVLRDAKKRKKQENRVIVKRFLVESETLMTYVDLATLDITMVEHIRFINIPWAESRGY